MPSRHYRINLRQSGTIISSIAPITTNYIYAYPTFNSNTRGIRGARDDTVSAPNDVINAVQDYFFNIIDIISTQNDVNFVLQQVNAITTVIGSKNQVFETLDLLENNVISIIKNIAQVTNISIIETRIKYIRELAATLPDCVDNYGILGQMITAVVENICNGADLTAITESIGTIKGVISTDLAVQNQFEHIQDTVLDIIDNIQKCVNVKIIEYRVEYLRKLIQDIVC